MHKVGFWFVAASGLTLSAACGGQIASDTPAPAPSLEAPSPSPSGSVTPGKPPLDADAAIDADADGSSPLDGGALDAGGWPAGASAIGVNAGSHTLGSEGLVLATRETTANPPGAFNGPGAGNKAFLGFSDHDGVLLSALGPIVVRARRDEGTPFFYLNLQVDCDGSNTWDDAVDGVVIVDSDALPALALETDAMTDVTIDPAAPIFKIVGAGSPPGPLKCGLFSHLSDTPLPLTSAPAAARLWNGDTGDNGMPRGTVMPAILFVLGDSNNLAARKVTVEKVTVGGKVYDFTR